MKKLITLVALFSCIIASAQSPKTISYQAILRDNVGVLIANDNDVSVRVSIIQGPLIENNVIYVENHDASTNSNGLFTLEIGGGSIESGNYANINWALGPYYLKTEIDPLGGTNYLITAVSELLSVPLANYAFESGRRAGIAGVFEGYWAAQTNGLELGDIVFTYIDASRAFIHVRDNITSEWFYGYCSLTDNTIELGDGLFWTYTLVGNTLTITEDDQGTIYTSIYERQ
jgi:hypothetical protein